MDPLQHFLTRTRELILRAIGPAVLVVLMLQCSLPPAAAQVSRDYELKAVCLWRLAQFVEWPTNAFADAESSLVICVLGKSPFREALNTVVKDETARGRNIVVEYHTRVDQIQACHILFVCESETRRVRQIVDAVAKRSVLTVSDIQDFTRVYNGMIRIWTDDNHIKFRIAPDRAAASGLILDSRLLRMADIVPKK